jgi:hypothetical protein
MGDKHRISMSAHVCCKQHRWLLIDMIEGFSDLGLRAPVVETVSLAGKKAELFAAVLPGDAEILAQRVLDALTEMLESNSVLIHGQLTVEASGEGMPDGLAARMRSLEERGYHVHEVQA